MATKPTNESTSAELDWPTVAEFLAEDQLQAQLEEAGFSRDTQEKLTDIFFKTIEDCDPPPLKWSDLSYVFGHEGGLQW